MRKKVFAVLVIVGLLAGMLSAAMPVGAAPPPPDYRPVDAGPRLRDLAPSDVALHLEGLGEAYAAAGSGGGPPMFYGEGDTRWALWYDDLSGLWLMPYTVAAVGEHIEVWVAADLDFPAGDPRNPVVVTQEQIDYLVEEFDTKIYPNNTGFFGMHDFHNGSNAVLDNMLGLPSDYYVGDDEEDRIIAMISNIGDENYYDPTYPLYIAGFYWGSVFEYYLDRNVISIDAYDWANRIGPDVARPHLYEGVFAHEFQHLIHDDMDHDEETWVDEGCADFAEFLNGYAPALYSHIRDTAAYPENSLVVWGDQGDLEILSDYGHAYLWTLYLFEKLPEDFIPAMVVNPDNGIAGVNSTLAAFSIPTDFSQLYHDYSIALLIDSEEPGGGAYNFKNIDFHLDIGQPGKRNAEAYATPGAPPWGTDYYLIWGYEQIANFLFNGYQFNPIPWTSDGDVLWGGAGDLIDNFMIAQVDLTGVSDATLTFDTLFDIEFAWDYGFVQVSIDGGWNWTSLANADTCSALASGAHPKVVTNVPGFTGVSGFGCNDPYDPDLPEYPTAQWITTSFDLSAYDGQEILVAFRYVTDWAYNEPGWYVDDVNIAGVFTSDGSSTDGFLSLNEVLGISNEYTVMLIGERIRRGQPEYEVQTILSGGYVADWASIRNMFDNYRRLVMLVTYDAPQGVTAYADYTFEIDHRGGVHINK